jgi:hypothetical protein
LTDKELAERYKMALEAIREITFPEGKEFARAKQALEGAKT